MPPAPSLTRDDIVDAAIRIITRDGAEALSMRKLAAELDSKPMTLYHYVDNKPELMRLVLTEIATRIPWARPTGSPRERMITVVLDMHEKLAEIPWIVPILTEGTSVGTPALALADTYLTAAMELGADAPTAIMSWRAVWFLVASELQWQATLARRTPDQKTWHETITPDEVAEFPTVAHLLPKLREYSAQTSVVDAVTAQIDGMLARIAREHTTQPAPPHR